MKDKVSDTIKIYRWIIRHKWEVTSPTPVDVLLDGWNKYKNKYVDLKLLKNEGSLIELTDPERLITFFRSRDGTFERRATLQLHQGIYEPLVIQLDDDDDEDNFNY
ncbi:hypothetical protein CAEBREN_25545 [Caenorhabditis brenneri]|uniref:Uncharacterized protein n=1 Tax=Caenorhabditis brenneri TaxID=135651 RepID=G0NX10_CAEBE|nr:hypothetical protein CAEBREN_25545 [Caenorhabditis brenneri]